MIDEEFAPVSCTSEEMFYNHMESQSLESLPIIYQTVKPSEKSYWQTIGTALDFIYSTGGEGKKLLDFGPGDGWPSLIVAPYAKEVIGIESSKKRVEVCTDNAKLLGISNAEFIHYPSSSKLPFDDETFDGVIASTSVEQSPDPKKTLIEFYRVLKPDGKVRLIFETLTRYRYNFKNDIFLFDKGSNNSRLVLYERDIQNEKCHHIGFTFSMPKPELIKAIAKEGDTLTYDMITIPALNSLKQSIIDVNKCTLTHPSGNTLVEWLMSCGFYDIKAVQCGGWFAGKLYSELPESTKPKSKADVESYLKPVIKVLTKMRAAFDDTVDNLHISAMK